MLRNKQSIIIKASKGVVQPVMMVPRRNKFVLRIQDYFSLGCLRVSVCVFNCYVQGEYELDNDILMDKSSKYSSVGVHS